MTRGAPISPPRRFRSAKAVRTITGWAFLAPLLGLNLVVVFGPSVATAYYSLTDWSGIGPAHWVGLANYTRALKDPAVHQALESLVDRVDVRPGADRGAHHGADHGVHALGVTARGEHGNGGPRAHGPVVGGRCCAHVGSLVRGGEGLAAA